MIKIPNFFKVLLVLEAPDYEKACEEATNLYNRNSQTFDIYLDLSSIRIMTDEEIFEFFEKTKKQMEV